MYKLLRLNAMYNSLNNSLKNFKHKFKKKSVQLTTNIKKFALYVSEQMLTH